MPPTVPPEPNAPLPTRGHVLLTGATGFLGQALLERLIVDYPETSVTLLVRRHGTRSAQERVNGLARRPVFSTLRERIGADRVRAELARRVRVIECDLSHSVPDLPDDLSAVVHGASTVSFDPPIDEAFTTNVRGTLNLYDAVSRLESPPHVVHISTAYVSATRKGIVREESLAHHVDWHDELRHAVGARADVERASRRPAVLRALLASAKAAHGKAGTSAVAGAAEEARRAWVTEQLVDAGRLRAEGLGWTDVYTLTKALGERIAEAYARDARLAVSIVRPTIVQCSLSRPYPGWFDSYKMMDPIVLAYGRGTLTEFPVDPENVIDLVPADLVTSATLRIADEPREPGDTAYFHVGTGARNPLTQRALHLHVRGYFERHPFTDGNRGHVKASEWRFPGATQLERRLRGGQRALELADRAVLRLPATERTRRWLDRIDERTQQLDGLGRLLDLYGPYGSVEAVYSDANLARLIGQQNAGQPVDSGFDSAELSWTHYLEEVYCPSVTRMSRTAARAKRQAPSAASPLPEDPRLAAFFDLEGTVIASNMLESYVWARLAGRPSSRWPTDLASLAVAIPGLARIEQRHRGEFIRVFMQRYAGASEHELRVLIHERVGDALLRRSLPEAIGRIRAHRAAGHRTVLITGAAEFLTEPLRPLFDEIAASRLHAEAGVLTGRLLAPPLIGEARAAWVRDYAGKLGLDLARSFAYGDSISDRPLLECVGNPVAVNPDAPLYRHAKQQSWRIEQWGAHAGRRLETALTAIRPAPSTLPLRGTGGVRW